MDAIEVVCRNCICFTKDDMKIGQMQGQCHRFPPQIVAVSAKTLEGIVLAPGAMFPQVGGDWWCMEFRPRENNIPDERPSSGLQRGN